MDESERKERLEQFRDEIEDVENVVGVVYDAEEEEFVALVAEKVSEDELPEDQIVANRTSLSKAEHGVEEVGYLRAHSLTIDTTERLRPVPAGAEEQPDGRGWVGTGSFLARVTDPTRGQWASDVSRGDVVRVSNWHVYVSDSFEAYRAINQPFRGETVGELVGAVPLADGVTVDAAARTVSEHDGWGTYDLDRASDGAEYGRSVLTEVTDDHVGETVTKSGRTTDVTTAEIRYTGASLRIDYGTPENPNLIRIDDCVVTTDLGDRGDSGSPVFLRSDGALCGLYFAGSDTSGVFCGIGNVQEELGVEPITDWNPDTDPVDYGSEDLEKFKRDLIEFVENWGE